MRTLLLIVVAFMLPAFSQAESAEELRHPEEQRQTLICDQLSDSRCFGHRVDSICMVDAQKGQAGFCRQRSAIYDRVYVRCWCL